MKKLLWPFIATGLVFSLGAEEAAKEEKNMSEDKTLSMALDSGRINHKSSDLECRLSQLEAKVNGFKTYNPVYGSFSVDFLYWRGDGNNWFYGFTGSGDGGTVNIFRGSLKWKPGVRVALNFSGLYDWTIGAEWTYYHNDSRVDTTKPIQPVVGALISSDLTSKVKLDYNTIDLNFGSNFRLNHTFEFNPYFGVRALLIKRSNSLDASGLTLRNPTAIEVSLKNLVKFNGYGPRLGLLASCNFGESGFSFYGAFSGALLYGRSKTKILTSTIGGSGGGGPAEIIDSLHDLKATFQFLAGMNYKYYFDHNNKSFFIRAHWENNYYWDLTDSFAFLQTSESGGASFSDSFEAVILNGVNVGIGFEY
jgi:hypothetical protein